MNIAFVDIIKFIHILSALSLTGLLILNYGLLCLSLRKTAGQALQLNNRRFAEASEYCALAIAIIAFFTGVLLITPKGFAFSTPWISAALTGLTLIMLLIGLNLFLRKYMDTFFQRYYHVNYWLIFIGLILIIHDAVTKHTLFGG